jgi:hypothetical protein
MVSVGVMRSIVVALTCVYALSACRKAAEAKTEQRTEVPVNPFAVEGLALRTSSDADDRVRRVFPNGPATQDGRKEVGAAPVPPDDRAPDPTSEWVAEITASPPLALAAVQAAIPPKPEGREPTVMGRTANGAWEYVQDDSAKGPFDKVAVTVMITDIDKPASAEDLDRGIAWARTLFSKIGTVPTEPISKAQALVRAATVYKLREKLRDDSLNVGVVVVAPSGKLFPGRLVWDAVYSAGFTWGDGDYFHWVPSPATDVSQGIGMGTSKGPGYFFPEWVARDDGSADVPDLEMSFDLARTHEPEAMFEVMVRVASYLARRLGGTLEDRNGKPFDAPAERARVHAMVKMFASRGLTPGTSIVLQVF